VSQVAPPRRLTLASSIEAVDRQLAGRRTGSRTKGPPAALVLAAGLGIETVGDLLRHYPRRYIDRSATVPIGELRFRQGQDVTIIGRVQRVDKRLPRRHQTMVTVVVHDGTGRLELPFFNQPWTASLYREGLELAVSGRAGTYRGRLQLQNQELEVLRGEVDAAEPL